MSNYLESNIYPGVGVGNFKLGSSLSAVESQLDVPFRKCDYLESIGVETDSITFFFSKDKEELICISVSDNFKGKIEGLIGIGSTLAELKARYQDKLSYEAEDDEYLISGARFSISQPGQNGEYKEIVNIIGVIK